MQLRPAPARRNAVLPDCLVEPPADPHGVLLVFAPVASILADGAGARPDHPLSGHQRKHSSMAGLGPRADVLELAAELLDRLLELPVRMLPLAHRISCRGLDVGVGHKRVWSLLSIEP
jgi:hypothetical protein